MKTVRAQQSKYFTPDSLKYNWDDIYLSIDIRYIFFSKCMKEKIHFKRILGLVTSLLKNYEYLEDIE